MRNVSYFITGGYGLIGSSIVNSINNGNVTILTRSLRYKKRVRNKGVKVLVKDLSKLEKKDLKNIDIIYHCASTVDNYTILSDMFLDVETNINSTITLLEVCRKLKKKPKIIFLSTFFVYGNEYEKTKIPINEESGTNPLALYPATKLCAEHIIKLYSRLYNIPYVTARLTNVYGKEENFNNPKKSALNHIIMNALKGKELRIYNGGNFYRDYIFIDDVTDALRFLEEKTTNETFLIGYGKPILFKTLIEYIHKLTSRKSKIIKVKPPPFHNVVGITNFVADTSKINKLGWSPKIDFQIGICQVIEEYKKYL